MIYSEFEEMTFEISEYDPFQKCYQTVNNVTHNLNHLNCHSLDSESNI